MKRVLLDKLVCPFDKQDLLIKIVSQEDDNIKQGILTCRSCNRYYPIIHGIPIMTPDEYREQQLELPILEKWGEKLIAQDEQTIFQLEQKKN